MRIRVRDLIEELQRFPPDDVVEFEVVRNTNLWTANALGMRTVKELQLTAEFEQANERGREVKIQLI